MHDPFTPPPDSDPLDSDALAPAPIDPREPANRMIYCTGCGNALTDATLGGVCPHCGTPTNQSLQRGGGSGGSTPGSAVASMVLGITSLVMCSLYGLPGIVCGILAIIFAGKAERMMRTGSYGTQGQGMVTAGRVCGWIGLALGTLFVLLIIAYAVFMFYIFQNASRHNPTWQPTPPPQQQPIITPTPQQP